MQAEISRRKELQTEGSGRLIELAQIVLKSEMLWLDRAGRARGELRLGWRRAAVAIGIRGWMGWARRTACSADGETRTW